MSMGDDPQAAQWAEYASRLQRGDHPPFDEQWARYCEIFADRPASLGPPPAWMPTEEHLTRSNLARLMADLGLSSYAQLHRWSIEQRGQFWAAMIDRLGIPFEREPDQALDLSQGANRARWLPGTELNIVDSCFGAPPDRAGKDLSPSPATGARRGSRAGRMRARRDRDGAAWPPAQPSRAGRCA